MLPLEVASLLYELNMGPLDVTRRSPPTKNQFGGYDANTPEAFVLDPAVWHDVTGRDLLQVPEADRNGGVKQIYGIVRQHVADGARVADVVTVKDRKYRMVKVFDYEVQGAVYFGMAVLEDVQAVP